MDGPTAAIEAHAGPIVWLASYPKSGNTWLRAFLTSYQRADHEAFSINGLVGPSAASRLLFDAYLGCSSSDMTAAEILAVRPRFHALLGRELTRPAFVKVHDAYIRASQAAAVFPRTATAGAVYLVRNPLDVAVSLAHHDDTSVDTAITKMNHAATLAPQVTSLSVQIPQPLLTWSAHVTSWLRDAEFPVHAARYEDLLADPAAGFGGIVRFCGLEWDPARLARAVEETAFHRLRDQEARSGFDGKPPGAASFFRAGVAGAWRTVLQPAQVQSLVSAHEPVMDLWGYLDEAQAYLAGRSRGPSGRRPGDAGRR